MNYDKVLLPQYMKNVLQKNNYENTWYIFHRGLCSDEPSKKYLKHMVFAESSKDNPMKTLNNVLKTCTESTKSYVTGSENGMESYYEILKNRSGYNYHDIDAESVTPLIIGMGSQSVSENSMQIHPVYGIPYIAGQQVKGVLRSFYLNEKFDGDENKAWKDSEFVFLFGKGQNEKECDSPYPVQEGHLIFYDVFPIERENTSLNKKWAVFHSAQMTNHYSDYYKSGKLTDGENPNPVSFLTIENLKMRFSFGIAKMCVNAYKDKKDLTELTECNEGDALTDKKEDLINN